MNKLIPFLIENWPFVGLFCLLLLGYLFLEFKDKLMGVSALSSSAAVQMINQKNTIVIDVRDKTDFDAGHVTGAINCQQQALADKLPLLQKNKTDPVVVICNNGVQSRRCAAIIKNSGYESVYTLKEGLNAWQKDQLPLVKS